MATYVKWGPLRIPEALASLVDFEGVQVAQQPMQKVCSTIQQLWIQNLTCDMQQGKAIELLIFMHFHLLPTQGAEGCGHGLQQQRCETHSSGQTHSYRIPLRRSPSRCVQS